GGGLAGGAGFGGFGGFGTGGFGGAGAGGYDGAGGAVAPGAVSTPVPTGPVAPPPGRVQGVVKAWNTEKGFGFASVEGCGSSDIFVHIVDCVDSQRPVVGDVLTFETEMSQKKDGTQNFKAKNVTG
ncbi:unnamed protein product, partial [Effrenium voratum]